MIDAFLMLWLIALAHPVATVVFSLIFVAVVALAVACVREILAVVETLSE